MNVDKKLEIFSQLILTAAEEKKDRMIRRATASFTGAVDDAVRAAEKQAQERIRTERYQIDKTRNKEVVAASAGAKRKLMERRDSLTRALFAEVTADVAAFVESPDYDTYLVAAIREAVAAAPGRYAYVQVAPRDMRLAAAINEAAGLTAEAGADDFIGGFKLITPDRRAISDQTLRTRIEEAQRGFSLVYGRTQQGEAV